MGAGPIKIAILANAAQAKREFQSTSKAASGFGKGLGKIGTVAKAGFAAAAVGAVALGAKVIDFVGESVDAASKLEQSTGAVEAVFGKQANGIKKAAEGAAQGFGLSKNSYQELASTLGAGFKNQGIKDFAGQTQKTIGLGADLAAQFGGSTSDAVQAIGSLMRGEADPIEKYGVSIKQSAISAELAAKGQSKLTGTAKTQAEAQARLKLLFQQTSDAQGAFGRESDTLAGKQARNAAAWDNLKAKLGTAFLPVMVQVQEFLATKVLPIVEQVFGYISANAPAVIAAVTGFLKGLKGDGTAVAYFEAVKVVIGLVAAVFTQIAAAVMSNWPAIQSAVTSAIGAIMTVAMSLKAFWDAWGPTISAVIGTAFTTAIKIISGAMQIIAGIIKTVTSVLTGDWKGAWEGIKQIVGGVLGIVKSLISNVMNQALSIAKGILKKLGINFTGTWDDIVKLVKNALQNVINNITSRLSQARTTVANVWNAIKGATSNVWNGIKSFIAGVWNSIVGTVATKIASARTTLSNGWKTIRTTVLTTWNAIVTTVRTKANALIVKIRAIPGQVKGFFSNAGGWLLRAGREIINGLIDGIREKIDYVKDLLSRLTDLIPDWKGPRSRDAKLLTENGKLIMQSLVKGFDKGQMLVRRNLQQLTNDLESSLTPTFAPKLAPIKGLDAVLSVGGSSAAGMNHYTINVTVDNGTDPTEFERRVVSAIDGFQRKGGRRRAG